MKSKSFKYWTRQDLNFEFGLNEIFTHSLFDKWLNSNEPISSSDLIELEKIRLYALKNIDYWNEEELKMNFIGAILRIADLSGPNYRTFFDRLVETSINGKKMYGRLDGVVANGFQNPVNPYFCIHEYKQENKREGDPKGQLLAGMLAAEMLNQNQKPVFGCSVLARSWYFVILENNQYIISKLFDSTDKDEIVSILKMLRFVKMYIDTNPTNYPPNSYL
jgi:hypothetical protein